MNLDSVKFSIGQTVYFVMDPERKGMVTGILFRPSGVLYYVTRADGQEHLHYDIELTAEKSFSTTLHP